MKKLSCVLLALVAAAVTIWCVPLQAAVRPPKLDYQRIVLPNGLVVILHQDRSTPIVHVELWYHVGSKNEKPGRTGFAHFFEHMMFKGSRNVEPEQHTSIVASVGGQANAYTNEDTTVFWQTLPSQYLPLVLWMEADRMASLRIDEKTFMDDLYRAFDDRAQVILQRLDARQWDLLVGVIESTDRVEHMMWRLIDPKHPLYDANLAAQYGDSIERVYRRADEFVGEVVKRVGPGVPVMIVSDQGIA